MTLLTQGPAKLRPVQLYECAVCGKDIAEEAVPIVVRVAAFIVPKAARDRVLEGDRAFDITDVGLPPLVRELVDQAKHPDGHVYVGLGCFTRIAEQRLFTDAGDQVSTPVPMRAALNAAGISNDEFTGREHRGVPTPVAPVADAGPQETAVVD